MAEYLPPTENVAIFDTLNFNDGDSPLTYNKAVKYFLRYPVAQGTETLQTTNVNGLLTASGNIAVQQIDSINTASNVNLFTSHNGAGVTLGNGFSALSVLSSTSDMINGIKTNTVDSRTTSATCTVFGSNQTGTINFATSQTSGTLNIGTGARIGGGGNGIINIGTGSATNGGVINIGTGSRDITAQINIGTSASNASQISIGGGTGSVFLNGSTSVICGQSTTATTTIQGVTTTVTSGSGGTSIQSGNTCNICTSQTGTVLNIATASNRSGIINLSTGASSSAVLNISTGTGNTGDVNILNGVGTGAGAGLHNTGSLNLLTGAYNTGNINMLTDATNTGTFTLGVPITMTTSPILPTLSTQIGYQGSITGTSLTTIPLSTLASIGTVVSLPIGIWNLEVTVQFTSAATASGVYYRMQLATTTSTTVDASRVADYASSAVGGTVYLKIYGTFKITTASTPIYLMAYTNNNNAGACVTNAIGGYYTRIA